MVAREPLWPDLAALDAAWASTPGVSVEQAKADHLRALAAGQVPSRPKILLIGAASPPIFAALESLMPSVLIQAYPPQMGMRPGPVPALMMDSDLPAFAGREFDFILMSHTLEYRAMPLALLSLGYEILQPQGRLLMICPHAFSPQALRPGHGHSYFHVQLRSLLKRAAYTPRGMRYVFLSLGRPSHLLQLAQPQVPPRLSGRLSLPSVDLLARLRRAQGVAAYRNIGLGPSHD